VFAYAEYNYVLKALSVNSCVIQQKCLILSFTFTIADFNASRFHDRIFVSQFIYLFSALSPWGALCICMHNINAL
jgi:hypothetical protein